MITFTAILSRKVSQTNDYTQYKKKKSVSKAPGFARKMVDKELMKKNFYIEVSRVNAVLALG